jgi:hypothetical protein
MRGYGLHGRIAAWGVGAAVLFTAARAEAQCPLELVPEGASPAWSSAARAASARIASTSTHDCGSVEIAVRPSGGALLTFITTDGRRAVRALMSPDEVVPALDALLVSLPKEPAEPLVPPAITPPPPSVPVRPPEAAPPKPAPPPPETHFILGGHIGSRFGFAGAYVTPALTLRPSGTFGPWELTGVAEFDPAYSYLPGDVPPGFKLWSFIAGIRVGRREALGNTALGYGIGVGSASIREEADDEAGQKRAVDFGQPRAAVYGHFVLPRTTKVRATFDLEIDLALSKFRKAASLRNDLPELPRWGIVLALGAESSLL